MENQSNQALRAAADAYLREVFANEMPAEYVYHNLQHTLEVRDFCKEIGEAVGLAEEELEILELAACFHDLGYKNVYAGHEEVGVELAEAFLREHQYPEEKIEKVKGCIMATKMPQDPQNLMEQVIGDADLYNLGKPEFIERSNLLRQEWETVGMDMDLTDEVWVMDGLNFLSGHSYHTAYANQILGPGKQENINTLKNIMAEMQSGENSPKETSGSQETEGQETTSENPVDPVTENVEDVPQEIPTAETEEAQPEVIAETVAASTEVVSEKRKRRKRKKMMGRSAIKSGFASKRNTSNASRSHAPIVGSKPCSGRPIVPTLI